MPWQAIYVQGEPSPLAKCPKCGAEPFEPFLRGQVVRFDWFGFRRRIWAVICRRCKEIVDYEAIP